MEKNKNKNKLNTVGKLALAGIWLLSGSVALGGFGMSAMAGIDAWQALSMEDGYGRMTEGEMVAYGASTAGAALFIAALTVGALVGLWMFWRWLSDEDAIG